MGIWVFGVFFSMGRTAWPWGLALTLALLPAPFLPAQAQPDGAPARYDYKLSFEGLGGIGLDKRARELSRLVTDKAKPVTSQAALNRRIQTDIAMLRRLLPAHGYYGARISHDIARDNGQTRVLIQVEPGPQFRFSAPDIAFTEPAGDGLADAVEAGLPLRADAPARHETILAAERLMMGRLPQHGHPFARVVERDVVADHAKNQVAVRFLIDAGPLVRFGELTFEGLDHVEPALLQRMAPWRQGDVYDQRVADDFRSRLYGSGLFATVAVAPQQPPDGTGAETGTPIKITVREAPHRTIGVNAGYSTSEGFSLEGSWTHRNFFGQGEEVTLLARAATLEQSLNATFAKPAFLRRDQVLRADTSLKREDTDAFTSYGIASGVALERSFGRHWVASLGARGEWVRINDNLTLDKRRFVLGALPASLRFDSTDDVLDPRRGARAALVVTPEAGLQDGAFGFATSVFSASAYYPLGSRQWTVLAARMKIGSILFSDTDRLPANRRFFAGGGGSIRGFGFQEVGPRDLQGDPLGGRSVVEFGFETRLRISETIGLVPFIEAGNVYEDSTPQFSGLRWGAGLGGRYYTGFAPVRLDVGVPINPRPGDKNFQIYLSIGQSF